MADWRVEEEGGSSRMPRGMFTRVRGGGGEEIFGEEVRFLGTVRAGARREVEKELW